MDKLKAKLQVYATDRPPLPYLVINDGVNIIDFAVLHNDGVYHSFKQSIIQTLHSYGEEICTEHPIMDDYSEQADYYKRRECPECWKGLGE